MPITSLLCQMKKMKCYLQQYPLVCTHLRSCRSLWCKKQRSLARQRLRGRGRVVSADLDDSKQGEHCREKACV